MIVALRIVLIVLLALLVVCLGYLEYKRQELKKKNMSFIESLNLTGLPIISFTNNDDIINLVLDTGSNTSIINSETLAKLRYKTSSVKNSVIGITGESKESNYVLIPLEYKGREYEMKCLATDMGESIKAIKEAYGVTIHGVLGTGFFKQYKYILDFNEMIAYSLKK